MDERSVLAYWSFRFALLGMIIAIFAILGYRLDIVHFRPALFGLIGAAGVGLLAALFGIIGLIMAARKKQSGRVFALAGLVLGSVVAVPILLAAQAGSQVPRIHDITTDLQDPPEFVAMQSVRGPTQNPLDRKMPANLAALQQAGYPDLSTALIQKSPNQVFEDAVTLVKERGWEIVAAVSAENSWIEATATTRIMGFKDDVVIRIRERGGESIVDMRSVSRVGQSDLGVNAARIKAFLTDLRNVK